MSTASFGRDRHPLGLPKGYVRSILFLMMAGMTCGVLLIERTEAEPSFPLYLLVLIGIMYVFYLFEFVKLLFGGPSLFKLRYQDGRRAETGFTWLVRVLLSLVTIAAPLAVLGWEMAKDQQTLEILRRELANRSQHDWLLTLAVVVGSLVAGIVVFELFVAYFIAPFLGEDKEAALEDVIAWVSLVGLVGLLIVLLIVLVINPGLQDRSRVVDTTVFGSIMAGIIAFYVGARSLS